MIYALAAANPLAAGAIAATGVVAACRLAPEGTGFGLGAGIIASLAALLARLSRAITEPMQDLLNGGKQLLNDLKQFLNDLIDKAKEKLREMGLGFLADLVNAGQKLMNAGFSSVDMALNAIKEYGLYLLGIYLAIRYLRR